jgi:hypothetical protein
MCIYLEELHRVTFCRPSMNVNHLGIDSCVWSTRCHCKHACNGWVKGAMRLHMCNEEINYLSKQDVSPNRCECCCTVDYVYARNLILVKQKSPTTRRSTTTWYLFAIRGMWMTIYHVLSCWIIVERKLLHRRNISACCKYYTTEAHLRQKQILRSKESHRSGLGEALTEGGTSTAALYTTIFGSHEWLRPP